MNCKQAKEQLTAYLDGEVTIQQRAAIEVHLAGCQDCAAEREALAALRADLSATVRTAGEAIHQTECMHEGATLLDVRENPLYQSQYRVPFNAVPSAPLSIS